MNDAPDPGPDAEGGQKAPLRGVALVAAAIALFLWAAFTVFMITKADTGNEVHWTRLAWIFASVEAVAFGAAGALWGTTSIGKGPSRPNSGRM
jgi:hypothetical protein